MLNGYNAYFKNGYREAAYVFGCLAVVISGAFGAAVVQNKLVEKAEQNKIQVEQKQKMLDSLRIDSIAKKAYFEGMQAVRDSIATAKK